jgi:hypothetical protein
MIRRLFLDHPQSVGESYAEHMGVAAGFGWDLLRASACCFVHALVPGLFERTGSNIIRDLHARMVTHRLRHAPPPADPRIWIAADI